jgi:anti-sigma regulatory factor (Ser/Thr protein kinase)
MSSTARATLAHEVFLYESPEDFVAVMAPFLREGLERGDKLFAATKPRNIDALREELGPGAKAVQLEDTAEWCSRPYERLHAFKRLVAELPPGGVLRALGEPVWSDSAAVRRQWARYESIINVALADAPMRFVCLYDRTRVPSEVLDYAERTHPARLEHSGSSECSAFEPPERFLPGRPEATPGDALELPLHGPLFRRGVVDVALEQGLAPDRVDDFVLAAHELMTNALRHGAAPVDARIWSNGEELVCRVSDAGPGVREPLAGWLPPPSTEPQGGWGLPIARQLADALEITSDGGGTTASVHALLEPGRLGA